MRVDLPRARAAISNYIRTDPFTPKKQNSGQRESNPHGQLGRLELYH